MLLVNSPAQTKPCFKKRKKKTPNKKNAAMPMSRVGKIEFKIPVVGCSEEFALSVG